MLQSTVVDSFWKSDQQVSCGQQQLTNTSITLFTRDHVPAEQRTTKEQRQIAIMSSCQTVAEIASTSIAATDIVLAEIGSLIDRLSIKQVGKHITTGGKTIEYEIKTVQAKEHVSNPPVQQKQTQVRKQPSAIGAPTTSSYKAAGARSVRERKMSEKARDLKALGRR